MSWVQGEQMCGVGLWPAQEMSEDPFVKACPGDHLVWWALASELASLLDSFLCWCPGLFVLRGTVGRGACYGNVQSHPGERL